VVSQPDVNRRLRRFVCVRLDWDQMQRYKALLPVPTQGDQVLLDPGGNPIPGIDPKGKRYEVAELIGLLDRVLERYPGDPRTGDDLELAWFLCNPEDQGLPGHFGAEAVARLERKPLLEVSGPVPGWLDEPAFLRRHLRQFVWTRGQPGGESRVIVRQLAPAEKRLASLDLASLEADELGRALDRAWREAMAERPMTARGYIDNPHGRWLEAVMEGAYREELLIRQQATEGMLTPPGRRPE